MLTVMMATLIIVALIISSSHIALAVANALEERGYPLWYQIAVATGVAALLAGIIPALIIIEASK